MQLFSHILIRIYSRRFNYFENFRLNLIFLIFIFISKSLLSLTKFLLDQKRYNIDTCLCIASFSLFQGAEWNFLFLKNEFWLWLNCNIIFETVILFDLTVLIISSVAIDIVLISELNISPAPRWLFFHSESHIVNYFIHVSIFHAINRTVLFLHNLNFGFDLIF